MHQELQEWFKAESWNVVCSMLNSLEHTIVFAMHGNFNLSRFRPQCEHQHQSSTVTHHTFTLGSIQLRHSAHKHVCVHQHRHCTFDGLDFALLQQWLPSAIMDQPTMEQILHQVASASSQNWITQIFLCVFKAYEHIQLPTVLIRASPQSSSPNHLPTYPATQSQNTPHPHPHAQQPHPGQRPTWSSDMCGTRSPSILKIFFSRSSSRDHHHRR